MKKAITEATWRKMHAEYVEASDEHMRDDDPPSLSALARKHEVPLREAKERAARGRWADELAANCARRWHAAHGLGARTEEEFCVRLLVQGYSHLAGAGPEGYRFAMAMGRDTWRRAMGPLHLWEASQALDAARADLDAAKARTPRESVMDDLRAWGVVPEAA